MDRKLSPLAQRRAEKRAQRLEAQARMAAEYARIEAIVASNACPKCGRELRRNNSLAGWWQCSQFGAVNFRADASQPSCSWQGFTR